MKKITIILLLGIYTMSVVGYGVKGFYCCDNLTSVKISFAENAHAHAVSTDKSHCCKIKYQYFKVKDNHVGADHLNAPAKFLTEAPVVCVSYQPVSIVSQKINVANSGNAPPLYNGVPVFIANCSYLI